MNAFWLGVTSSAVAGIALALVGASRGWVSFNWRLFRQKHALMKRLEDAGMTNFYSCRADYALYRGAATLTDYVRSASSSIRIAAYWMADGVEMEGIAEHLAEMVRPPKKLEITVATIDPTAPLLSDMAQYLGLELAQLRSRIQWSLFHLDQARSHLSDQHRSRFQIKVYRSLPVASVVMIDPEGPQGRIQIDIKPYRAPRHSSFSFELAQRGHPLYELCKDSWLALIQNAEEFDPKKHQGRRI